LTFDPVTQHQHGSSATQDRF